MKAVLLAGGLGTRMKEQTEFRPKPMVEVGGRPVLWHIMKWYSSFGVTEFVLLTGYKSESIKQYFANYRVNNYDFEVQLGDPDSLRFVGPYPESEWKVTILDTGLGTPTAGRILRAKSFLDSEAFHCTYGDGLSDIDVTALLNAHKESSKIATVSISQPRSRFGEVLFDSNATVTDFLEKPSGKSWVNMGYFIFEPEIFNYLADDAMLEDSPMAKLVSQRELNSFPHQGFWQPMDTQREYEMLQQLWESGTAPWRIV